MSKYDNDKTVCACDKFSFLLDDYESEKLAHNETQEKLRKALRWIESLEKAFENYKTSNLSEIKKSIFLSKRE